MQIIKNLQTKFFLVYGIFLTTKKYKKTKYKSNQKLKNYISFKTYNILWYIYKKILWKKTKNKLKTKLRSKPSKIKKKIDNYIFAINYKQFFKL